MSRPRCLARKTNYPEFECGAPSLWTVVYWLPSEVPGGKRRRRIFDACARHLHKVCKRATDQGVTNLVVVSIED